MPGIPAVLPTAVRIGSVVGWNDVGETGTVTAELKRRHYAADQVAELGSGNVMRVSQAAIEARKPGA
ncbi:MULTISPECIES: membrane dipeptidase [unclassified Sphingomonas]|uniref:membrane dipeptidase n=1 Tax=unclassified Sphingomonas TaxID=196159 RepID=UPI000A422D34|nr:MULTISPECIES: membrane dipeptidase [unclassified Sphingomonas]